MEKTSDSRDYLCDISITDLEQFALFDLKYDTKNGIITKNRYRADGQPKKLKKHDPSNSGSRRKSMKKFSFAAAIAVVLVLGGCSNILSGLHESVHGTGTVSLHLDISASNLSASSVTQLTLRPDEALTISEFALVGTGPGGARVEKEFGAIAAGDELRLAPGEWNFTAEAKNSVGTVLGHGSATISVQGGQSSSLSITVRDLEEKGTLRFNLFKVADGKVSEERMQAKDLADLFTVERQPAPAANADGWQKLDITEEGAYHVSNELEPGTYVIRITSNGIELSSFSARIVSNIVTSGIVRISKDDLTGEGKIEIEDNITGPDDPGVGAIGDGLVNDVVFGETPFEITGISVTGRTATVDVKNEQDLELTYTWKQDGVVQEISSGGSFTFTGEYGTRTTIVVTVSDGNSEVASSILFTIRREVGSIGPAGGMIVYVDEENEHEWSYMEAAPDSIVHELWAHTQINEGKTIDPWPVITIGWISGTGIGDGVRNHKAALAALEEVKQEGLPWSYIWDEDTNNGADNWIVDSLRIFHRLEYEYGDVGWILPSYDEALIVGNVVIAQELSGFTPNAGIRHFKFYTTGIFRPIRVF